MFQMSRVASSPGSRSSRGRLSRALRCLRARSKSVITEAKRGLRATTRVSIHERRSAGSPRTRLRSSGAKTTAETSPRISLIRTGDRLTRARFAPLGLDGDLDRCMPPPAVDERGDRRRARALIDERGVEGHTMRAQVREVPDRLDDVRLAGTVVGDEGRHPGRELEIELRVRPEATRESRDIHIQMRVGMSR